MSILEIRLLGQNLCPGSLSIEEEQLLLGEGHFFTKAQESSIGFACMRLGSIPNTVCPSPFPTAPLGLTPTEHHQG